MAGWAWSSIRRVTGVGPQVLETKAPVPRKVLWYHDHVWGSVLKAETWKPIQAPPLSMYCWNALCWLAVCGRSSRNMTTWYCESVAVSTFDQSSVAVHEKPFCAAICGNHCFASLSKLACAASPWALS